MRSIAARVPWRNPDRGRTDGVGIYDRDYYRQGRSGFRLRAPRTAIGAIIGMILVVHLFVMDLDVVYAKLGRLVERKIP